MRADLQDLLPPLSTPCGNGLRFSIRRCGQLSLEYLRRLKNHCRSLSSPHRLKATQVQGYAELAFPDLAEDAIDDVAMNVCQAEVATLEPIGQLFMIEAQ